MFLCIQESIVLDVAGTTDSQGIETILCTDIVQQMMVLLSQ